MPARYSRRLPRGGRCFFSLLSLTTILVGCAIPTPGVIEYKICYAYGPNPTVIEWRPDGTVIERRDQDSPEAIKETLAACR